MQQFQVAGQCSRCEENKDEFISIVFPNGNVLTMCMDCYAEAMRKINDVNNKDTGARA